MTSKIGNSARRRLESEPVFTLPKQLNFSKLSDAGRPQSQWLSDEAENQFLKSFQYIRLGSILPDEKKKR
jgi:hypothetical protein